MTQTTPVWRREVRFAYIDEPPFCFVAENGAAAGCDVDLARLVLGRLGVETFTPLLVGFGDLIPGLRSGRFAMTTGLFVTPERAVKMSFSRPIWALADGLLVRRDNPGAIADLPSLARHVSATLAVVTGQVQRDRALRAGVSLAAIREYPSQEAASAAVADGSVDAYLTVEMAHRAYLARRGGDNLLVIPVAPGGHDAVPLGAFGFPKQQEGFRDAVNSELAGFLGSGEHRALMSRYGFQDCDVDRPSRLLK